ncbi:hypothetical protein JOQ06_016166 [Pogonophryne albipinna]|uniref:Uncharacterized protein n=1 Tax=Pogonophryne albipinna TaxID=1090488 RepID=A0AAD6AP86_9TELE|nr:hypothetical protein JOQ06_016166 [Pogonophryne albipinna]
MDRMCIFLMFNKVELSLRGSADPRFPGTSGDTPCSRTHVPSLEAQQVVGRASLDIFSPVREDSQSLVHRKTPLGTPLTAGRCYSPLSVFQTPLPIKEEEPITAESCDPGRLEKGSSSSLEGEGSTPPTSPQLTNHSQPAPPFFTPELRRANGIQAQLNYESPAQGAPPTAADLLESSDVLGLSLGNTDFQLPPKIFYGVEIWRLARPLQDLEMLLTKPLLRCPGGVFVIIVMLKDPATKLQTGLDMYWLKQGDTSGTAGFESLAA